MKIEYVFKTASRGLLANKSRSALTILGIVIGITAIILVMSLGEGAQNLILGQIQSIGSKTIVVHPGRKPQGISDTAQMFTDSLKQKDLDALLKKENVPHATKVEPLNLGAGTAVFENQSYNLTIFGASSLVAQIYDIKVDDGRFIDEDDVRNRADVIVIGSKVKEELFGQSEAVGQKVKIKGRNFRVVGTIPKKGQFSFVNFDEAAVMPYTTAQIYVFGVKFFNHILVEIDSEANLSATVSDIETTLRISHGITDPTKDDFWVVTQESAVQQVSTITTVLTLFLTAMAAISLLVGGVGIMNIMLVSVTERTREIGLRKALGATDEDILTHFLLEATILTSVGGVIGILLGLFMAFLISLVLTTVLKLDWTFSFPLLAIVLGLGVSGAVGLVFGLYPAGQAAKKSPIEALRYE